MNPAIVFLQGPPGSGKDTIAHIIAEQFGYEEEKFAAPIRAYLNNIWELDLDQSDHIKKAQLLSLVPGTKSTKTIRDLMIAYSERFMKPMFGIDVFGHLLAGRMSTLAEYVISDSGFPHEAEPIIERFGIETCVAIKVYRSGHTFEGDSRNYWSRPGLRSFALYNNGDLIDLEEAVLELFRSKVLRAPGTFESATLTNEV